MRTSLKLFGEVLSIHFMIGCCISSCGRIPFYVLHIHFDVFDRFIFCLIVETLDEITVTVTVTVVVVVVVVGDEGGWSSEGVSCQVKQTSC